jgi:hypothetical protein
LPKACMTGQKAKILVAIRREGRFSVAGDRSREGQDGAWCGQSS